MNITRNAVPEKNDIRKYLLQYYFDFGIFFHAAILLIVIISIIEGLILGFTVAHNIIYFFAACNLIGVIFALIAILIHNFVQYRKHIINRIPFTISLNDIGYIVKAENVELNRTWEEDIDKIIMLKEYIGFVSSNHPLFTFSTRTFTKEELIEIDKFFSTSSKYKRRYNRSRFFEL